MTLLAAAGPASADEAAARRWVQSEFALSTLSESDAMAEMDWFINAAMPYRGMEINVISETTPGHEYEGKVLAKAFTDITGIKVGHEIAHPNDVMDALGDELDGSGGDYDAVIADADMLGTLLRSGKTVDLTAFMAGEGRNVTDPTLELDDFFDREIGAGPGGHLYGIPDEETPSLYWFRDDWFRNPDYRARFKARYGYDLGVPTNWTAYRDIAAFFTEEIGTIDGKRVYGHLPAGHSDAWESWRDVDALFSLAGAGDTGLPNGLPVDEWGVRMEGCNPLGSAIERGGDTNGPAAAYAVTQSLDWLKRFAPPGSAGLAAVDAGVRPAEGDIAQMIGWNTTAANAMIFPDTAVIAPDGAARWHVAPAPHGAYWKPGMKEGYRHATLLTLFADTTPDKRMATWLYEQFLVSRTVSLRKAHAALSFVRQSDLWDPSVSARAPQLGGIVEFERSPVARNYTPSGLNISQMPDFAPLWFDGLNDAVAGRKTPQAALDAIAAGQDAAMADPAHDGSQGACGPRLDPQSSADDWFAKAQAAGTTAPQRRLSDEAPKGTTIDYDTLVKSWSMVPASKG